MSERKRGGKKRAHKPQGKQPIKKGYAQHIFGMMSSKMVNRADGGWRSSRDWEKTLCGKES